MDTGHTKRHDSHVRTATASLGRGLTAWDKRPNLYADRTIALLKRRHTDTDGDSVHTSRQTAKRRTGIVHEQ